MAARVLAWVVVVALVAACTDEDAGGGPGGDAVVPPRDGTAGGADGERRPDDAARPDPPDARVRDGGAVADPDAGPWPDALPSWDAALVPDGAPADAGAADPDPDAAGDLDPDARVPDADVPDPDARVPEADAAAALPDGAVADPDATPGPACEPGDRQLRACGLNARGLSGRTCTGDGAWPAFEPCADPDECRDGALERAACPAAGAERVRACFDGRWRETVPCPPPVECEVGTSERRGCGLRDNGTERRDCVGGFWGAFGPCDDPDRICGPGDVELQACGINRRGVERRVCQGDRWASDGGCVDPDVCPDGASQAAPCGLNLRGRGTVRCVAGRWTAPEACEDPDVCADGVEDARPCGLNLRGAEVRQCDVGQWGGFRPCEDPDECVDERTDRQICGLNDAGEAARRCVHGRWSPFGPCDDPDECVTGTGEDVACPDGLLSERFCEGGRWSDPSACRPPGCAGATDAGLGLQRGRLAAQDAMLSPSCAGAAGERVYRFTAPESGGYVFDARNAALTNVTYLRAVCEDPFAELACGATPGANDPWLALEAGQTVWVVVDAREPDRDFTLTISRLVPGGRTCEAGPDGPVELALGRSAGRTVFPGLTTASCAESSGGEGIHTFRAPAAGRYRFETVGSDFDTVLSVRRSCADAGTEIACDDNGAGQGFASRIDLELGAGEVIFVLVDGFFSSGRYVLAATRLD